MKWIVVILFLFAVLLFAVGKWTRVSGRSPDERAGSDIPYLLAALLTALAVILLVAWAIANLFF
jgi:uncharacterized protein HemY